MSSRQMDSPKKVDGTAEHPQGAARINAEVLEISARARRRIGMQLVDARRARLADRPPHHLHGKPFGGGRERARCRRPDRR